MIKNKYISESENKIKPDATKTQISDGEYAIVEALEEIARRL